MNDRELFFETHALYTACSAALDALDFPGFLACFAGDCSYSIHSKENIDRGWPLAFVSCTSRGMLEDRVAAVQKSSFIVPRVQRRIVSGVRVVGGEPLRSEASFAVFETFEGKATTLFMAGRFEDALVREDGVLKFRERRAILDSSIVPNSLPYPL